MKIGRVDIARGACIRARCTVLYDATVARAPCSAADPGHEGRRHPGQHSLVRVAGRAVESVHGSMRDG